MDSISTPQKWIDEVRSVARASYLNLILSFLCDVLVSIVVRPTQSSTVQLVSVNGTQFCPFVLQCTFDVVDAVLIQLLKNSTSTDMMTVFSYTVSIDEWTLSGDLQVSFFFILSAAFLLCTFQSHGWRL
jgi:hypothetical protein